MSDGHFSIPHEPSHGSLSDGEMAPLMTPKSRDRNPKSSARRRHTITFGEIEQPWTWRPEDAMGTMGAPAFVVNMFADLCPPGLLPLAAGLNVTGYIPAFVIMVAFCSACIYTMWAVSRTAEITGGKTFRSQWAATIGKRSSWVPVAMVVLVCFGCTLAYSCFFADIFASVMPARLNPLPKLISSRSLCLILFTTFPLLPLCMLKDLSALAYSSFAAVLVVIYTAGMMIFRTVDGSYAQHGTYWSQVPYTPDIPKERMWGYGLGSLCLVNFLAMGYLSHYNACKYYRELREHTPAKLVTCTSLGMGFTSVFYIITSVAGFETFGQSARSVILENYAHDDPLAHAARIGMGFSIIASFPLMFSGLREAVIELLAMIWPALDASLVHIRTQNTLSAILLLLITASALVCTDAGLVVGLVGAVCGSATIYVIPCLLYVAALQSLLSKDKHMLEIAIAISVATMGGVLGVVGVLFSLDAAKIISIQ